MIKFRKQSYFDKYLDIINDKSRTLKKYGYYIKIPTKYDFRFWLLAALKKKLFDVETPKKYYNLSQNEATEPEIKKMRFSQNKGGILIFPNDLDITMKYAENFHSIFQNKIIKKMLRKYPDGILWSFGRRYRGIYKNQIRNKTFNAASNTLEILGLSSIDLINISVRLAVQFQQPILMIKDLNNETMIIIGKTIKEKKNKEIGIVDFEQSEFTDFDLKKIEMGTNTSYKLCSSGQHNLWEMYDIYPKFNEFWIEGDNWYGK